MQSSPCNFAITIKTDRQKLISWWLYMFYLFYLTAFQKLYCAHLTGGCINNSTGMFQKGSDISQPMGKMNSMWTSGRQYNLFHFDTVCVHILHRASSSISQPSLCHLPGVLFMRLTPSSVTFVFIPSVTSYSYPRILSAPLLYPERGPWSQQLPVSQKTPLFPPSVFPRLPPHPLPQHPCGTFPPSPLVHSLLTSAGWGVPLSVGSVRVELSLNWSVEAEFSVSVLGTSVSRLCLCKYDSN